MNEVWTLDVLSVTRVPLLQALSDDRAREYVCILIPIHRHIYYIPIHLHIHVYMYMCVWENMYEFILILEILIWYHRIHSRVPPFLSLTVTNCHYPQHIYLLNSTIHIKKFRNLYSFSCGGQIYQLEHSVCVRVLLSLALCCCFRHSCSWRNSCLGMEPQASMLLRMQEL